MLSTLYGDIDYNDKASVEDWISNHALAHRQYRVTAASIGINLQTTILSGEVIDDDWFARHGFTHIGLEQTYQPGVGPGAIYMLSGTEVWKTEERFYDWHQNHNQLHQRINSALGIS